MQPEAQSPTSNSEGGQDEGVQSGKTARTRESASLKRGREGSMEPYAPSGAPALTPIVSKKNRVATTASNPVPKDSVKPSSSEANNVGEVRRKVEKMTWKEGEARPEGYESIEEDETEPVVDKAGTSPKKSEGRGTVDEDTMALSVKGDEEDEEEPEQNEEKEADDVPLATVTEEETIDTKKEDEGKPERSNDGLKRKVLERSQSSIQAVESVDAKRLKDDEVAESATTSASAADSSPAPAPAVQTKKPQASFSSFSSSASPFAKIGASSPTVFGPSSTSAPKTFASTQSGFGNTKSSSPFGDFKSPEPTPVAQDTPAASSGETSSAATKTPVVPPSPFPSAPAKSVFDNPSQASKPTSTPVKSSFSGSGFGNYSSTVSPFTSKSTSSKTQPIKQEGDSGDNQDEEGKDQSGDGAGPSKSFGDILQGSGEGVEDEKTKVQMTEQDLHTGEEDESTVYQSRVKLYVMQSDGGWRERGVGTLRLNVRRSDGRGARLVMRAEGVLRLILNVSLYAGMPCLEDGKHVRMTVFEEKERRFITFRTGSQKAATELTQTILSHLPLESATSANPSKSFTSPRDPTQHDHDDDSHSVREKEGVVEKTERVREEEEADREAEEGLRRAEEGDGAEEDD